MANLVTSLRIICAIGIIFTTPFSEAFYCLYLIAGLSDILDGIIARKTNTVSEFGSKLDTAADFIFVIVCLIKVLPHINVEPWIYIWVISIGVFKIISLIIGLVKYKKLVPIHSKINKLVGLLLFIFPFCILFLKVWCSCIFLCFIASIAAIHEHYKIIKL